MPRSVSDEELLLKKRARRRLVGAIVLVTLVIVLLPMFLDSEPRPLNQEINIQIPPQSSQFSSAVAEPPPGVPVQGGAKAGPDLRAAEAAKSAAAGETEKALSDTEMKAEPGKRATESERRPEPEKRVIAKAETSTKAEPKSAPKSEPKSAPKTESKPAAEAPKEREKEKEGGGGEGFVVQVAAYADAERARTLKGRISSNGLRAYTEVVKTAKGDVTRVRVGPFGSKEAAQKAADDLKKIGLSGVVAPKG